MLDLYAKTHPRDIVVGMVTPFVIAGLGFAAGNVLKNRL